MRRYRQVKLVQEEDIVYDFIQNNLYSSYQKNIPSAPLDYQIQIWHTNHSSAAQCSCFCPKGIPLYRTSKPSTVLSLPGIQCSYSPSHCREPSLQEVVCEHGQESGKCEAADLE
jgi:hypothetical protein